MSSVIPGRRSPRIRREVCASKTPAQEWGGLLFSPVAIETYPEKVRHRAPGDLPRGASWVVPFARYCGQQPDYRTILPGSSRRLNLMQAPLNFLRATLNRPRPSLERTGFGFHSTSLPWRVVR
jgi:hypothetical protein